MQQLTTRHQSCEHKRLAETYCATRVCVTKIEKLALSARPFTKDNIDYLNGGAEMQANAIYEPGLGFDTATG